MKAFAVEVFLGSEGKTVYLGSKLYSTASAAEEYIELRKLNDNGVVCNVSKEIQLSVMQMQKLALDGDGVRID